MVQKISPIFLFSLVSVNYRPAVLQFLSIIFIVCSIIGLLFLILMSLSILRFVKYSAVSEMESRDWRLLFDRELASRSTGVPYVRAAAPSIDIICTSAEDNPLCLSFAQNVNDDVGGVIWDCGLLLVDYVLALAARHDESPSACRNSSRGKEDIDPFECVLDLGTGTGVAGIVAAINGARRCLLTDYKCYSVLQENLVCHQQYILGKNEPCHSNISTSTMPCTTEPVCSFVEYSW